MMREVPFAQYWKKSDLEMVEHAKKLTDFIKDQLEKEENQGKDRVLIEASALDRLAREVRAFVECPKFK